MPTQIISKYTLPFKNINAYASGNDPYIRRARPLKHWRRQLHTVNSGAGSRYSYIGVMDKPGGLLSLEAGAGCSTCDINGNGVLTVENKILYPIAQTPCYGKCINRSATTVLSKTYYQTNSEYLRNRCKKFNDKLVKYEALSGSSPNQPNSYRASCCSSKVPGGCNNTVYKRSNPKYDSDGAVPSSSRIDRLKLDTIRGAGNINKAAFTGASSAAANALSKYRANGVTPYTHKSLLNNFSVCPTKCAAP
jgi:hypothetical protein